MVTCVQNVRASDILLHTIVGCRRNVLHSQCTELFPSVASGRGAKRLVA